MAELLFGEKLRRAEEELLRALQMHRGAWEMPNDYFREENIGYPMREEMGGMIRAYREFIFGADGIIRGGAAAEFDGAAGGRVFSAQDAAAAAAESFPTMEDNFAVQRENGRFTPHNAAATVSAGADMQQISDFFRRDSRRYDGGFKRY